MLQKLMWRSGRSILCAAAVFAALSAGATDYYWYLSDGYANSGNAWADAGMNVGTVPSGGDVGRFDQAGMQSAGKYTVRIPGPASAGSQDGAFHDPSATYVRGLAAGTELVFDATGAYWAKVRGETAWPGKNILNIGYSDHVFNLEDVNSEDPRDVLGFLFSDGVIRYSVSAEGEELAFESGTFDNHSILDNACRHTTVLIHSTRPGARIVFKGGETHLNKTNIRGNSEGGEVLVDGGDVHFWNGVHIKCAWGDSAPDGVLRIHSGTATLESGSIALGNQDKAGRLVLDGGTLVLANTGDNLIDFKTDANSAFVMSGSAKLDTKAGNFKVKSSDNDQHPVNVQLLGGTLDATGKEILFGGGHGSSIVFGGATVLVNQFVIEGRVGDPTHTNTVRQTAGSVTVTGEMQLRTNSGGRNDMYALEGGELEVRGSAKFGTWSNSNGATGVFRQTGGVSTFGGDIILCNGEGDANGVIELSGGVMHAKTIYSDSGCETRNGAMTAKASCLFDGGTIVAYADSQMLIKQMSETKVGEDGLAIDTDGCSNVGIAAKLENADGEQGLFVKKGAGTLKMAMVDTESTADGWAGRSLAATHSSTRVDQGTLEILGGGNAAAFGADVEVRGGATLALGDGATTLTVSSLALGGGRGLGVLKLKSGDKIIVNGGAQSLSVTAGAVEATWATTEGAYPVFAFRDGAPSQETLDSIVVTGTDGTKDFGWSTIDDPNGSGYTVVLLNVAPAGTYTRTISYDGTSATTNGQGRVSRLEATGTAAQSGELPLAATATADVAEGVTLTLHGPLEGTGAVLSKTGSGTLVVDGGNPDFDGSFASSGGILEIASAAAFGTSPVSNPLILGAGTMRYTDTVNEAEFESILKIDAGAHKTAAVLDNAGDMTFTGTEYVQGFFVKKGAGTLTLDLPAGSFMLGSSADDENVGDAGLNGLHGVDILEGTLKVIGVGTNETVLSTLNTSMIGGGYAGAAPAALEIENARVNWGTSSRHGQMGRGLPANAPAPELHLRNAYMTSDSLRIGSENACADGPVVTLVDSTIENNWAGSIGGWHTHPRLYATNSVVTVNNDGWFLSDDAVDIEFYGSGAVFASTSSDNSDNRKVGRVSGDNGVGGSVRFISGARLETKRGISFANVTLDMAFDGGVYRILSGAPAYSDSTWGTAGTGIVTTGAGLEIDICSDTTHEIKFPISGDGGVVKTGAGTLVLAKARTEGEKLLRCGGPVEIAGGMLTLDGALADVKSVKVRSGATLNLSPTGSYENKTELSLDSFEAQGNVAFGRIAAPLVKFVYGQLPNFMLATIASGKRTVEIDFGESQPVAGRDQPFAVAHFYADQNGTPLPAEYVDVSRWTGMATGFTKETLGGRGGVYRFTYYAASGTLSAQFTPRPGFLVIIR